MTKIQCEQEKIIEIDTAQYKMVNQNKENMKDVKGERRKEVSVQGQTKGIYRLISNEETRSNQL